MSALDPSLKAAQTSPVTPFFASSAPSVVKQFYLSLLQSSSVPQFDDAMRYCAGTVAVLA